MIGAQKAALMRIRPDMVLRPVEAQEEGTATGSRAAIGGTSLGSGEEAQQAPSQPQPIAGERIRGQHRDEEGEEGRRAG